LFDGREIGTAFYAGPNGEPYNPDFAALARSCGVQAATVTRSEDLAGTIEIAVRANKPYLIDVHVDADVRPPSTGAWALPPTPHTEPVFGKKHVATAVEAVK
jgi:acetolactate synthase-1/2/3 large subunit